MPDHAETQRTGGRLLADRMLVGPARWLRLAGYDCALLEPAGLPRGAELPDVARLRRRRLVTASRRVHALAPREVILVEPGDHEKVLLSVFAAEPIDWRARALRRCSLDNQPIEEIDSADCLQRLPPRVRERHPFRLRRCPNCDRLYWPGDHSRAILERLEGLLP